MVKLFLTGTTGYIGGDALYAIVQAHPELEEHIAVLARNSDRGATVAAKYPKVKLVYGNLEDAVVRDAAEEADVVMHFADCDNVPAATSITSGLAARASRNLPAYLIHNSGTAILEPLADLQSKTVGEPSDKVYSDLSAGEVTSLPDGAPHRPVDKIILSAGTHGGKVKTAIVCPPTIYGPGRGPDKHRSTQWPLMAHHVLQRGRGFVLGRGLNRWTYVHVHDLSALYVLLLDDALTGISGGRTKGTWNGEEGYYFASAGEYAWGEMASHIAREAHAQGFIASAEVDHLSAKEAEELMDVAVVQWGENSRGKAERARKVFGWTPKGDSPKETLPGLVRTEAELLGLKKSHAQVAAGE